MMMTPASSLEDRMRILEGFTVRMSEQLNDRLDGRITRLEGKVDRNHAEVMAKLGELTSR